MEAKIALPQFMDMCQDSTNILNTLLSDLSTYRAHHYSTATCNIAEYYELAKVVVSGVEEENLKYSTCAGHPTSVMNKVTAQHAAKV